MSHSSPQRGSGLFFSRLLQRRRYILSSGFRIRCSRQGQCLSMEICLNICCDVQCPAILLVSIHSPFVDGHTKSVVPCSDCQRCPSLFIVFDNMCHYLFSAFYCRIARYCLLYNVWWYRIAPNCCHPYLVVGIVLYSSVGQEPDVKSIYREGRPSGPHICDSSENDAQATGDLPSLSKDQLRTNWSASLRLEFCFDPIQMQRRFSTADFKTK